MKVHLSLITGIIIIGLLGSCSKKDAPSKNNSDNNIGNNDVSGYDKNFKGISGSGFAAAMQSDGKIIVAGSFGSDSQYSYKVYRLNQDGTVDNTFNIDADKSWFLNGLSAVAVLNDGRILLGGDFTINGTKKFMVRLSSNGLLDKSFTSPSFNYIANSQPYINKIIVLSGDRVLVAGSFNTFLSNKVNYNHLIKIDYNGLLDPDFRLDISILNGISDVIPLTDGSFYIAGGSHYVTKINKNGAVDASFNFKETLNSTLGSGLTGYISSIALQPDGKLIIGGDFSSIEDKSMRDGIYNYSQIARLNIDGSIDMSFKASDGVRAKISKVSVLSDGRLLIGRKTDLNAATGNTYLSLFEKNGEQNKSFNIGLDNSDVSDIIKQDNNRFILLGIFTDASQNGVIRINVN